MKRELSPRQLEVVRMIAKGCGDKKIADALAITTHTVDKHVRAIKSKLKAQSRSHAVYLLFCK